MVTATNYSHGQVVLAPSSRLNDTPAANASIPFTHYKFNTSGTTSTYSSQSDNCSRCPCVCCTNKLYNEKYSVVPTAAGAGVMVVTLLALKAIIIWLIFIRPKKNLVNTSMNLRAMIVPQRKHSPQDGLFEMILNRIFSQFLSDSSFAAPPSYFAHP